MSSLDKLVIGGVRSFAPGSHEHITFDTPLTLIVGANGCGKTTIIECLRYATTGEMPPNTKMNANWINDPKLVGETITKALVKLQFQGIVGGKMVVARRLQAEYPRTGKTKNRAKMSTLDGSLATARNGEKTSLSTRARDLDTLVPQYLGVSKAVLNNVIFCHQDESLWPLSEPAVLKKKFDQIFEAEKYTAAIKNISDLRKKQNVELAKFKIIEEHAKQDKDKGRRLEQRSTLLTDEVEALRAQTDELQDQINDAENKKRTAQDNANRFEVVIGQIFNLRQQQQFLHQRIAQLGQDLEETDESDERLHTELENHEERLEQHSRRREECHDRYNQVKQEIGQLRGQQDLKRTEAGTFKEQKRAHEQKIKDREELVKSSAREHNIRGYDTDLDDMQVGEFMDRIARLSKDQTSKVDKLRRENAAETRKIQDILDGLNEKRTSAMQSKNHARGAMSDNERRILAFQSDLDKITSDEGGKAVIEANIEELQNKLASMREESSSAGWAAQLQACNAKIRELEENAEALNKELMDSTSQSTKLAELNHLKQDSKDKQIALNGLLATHGEAIKALIGHDIGIQSLDEDIASTVRQKNSDLAKAQRERDSTNRDIEKTDFKLQSAKAQLQQKESELKQTTKTITDSIDGTPEAYLETLAELQRNRNVRADDVKGFHVIQKWYKDCIKTVEKSRGCRLCKRGFEDQKQIDQFVARLQDSAKTETLAQLQEELDGLETELQAAQDVRGSYDIWRRLETEVPALKEEIQTLEDRRKELLRTVEAQDETVHDLEDGKRGADLTAKNAANIVRAQSELQKAQKQYDNLVANHSQGNQLRLLNDIKEDLDKVNRDIRELRTSQSKIQADEKRSRDKLAALELELSHAKSRLITAAADLERKTTKLTQIEDLKQANQQQRVSMQKYEEELQAIEPRLQAEQSQLTELRKQGQSRENELQREANDIMNNMNMLTNADREIRFYIDQGGPAKLAQCEREIQGLDSSITSLESEHRQITSEINRIQTDLSNADRLKRIIHDNLNYREAQRELQRNQHELQALEAQDAEADQARYRADFDRYSKLYDMHFQKRVSAVATMTVKSDEVNRMVEEWNTDYKDAAKNYKKAHVEVVTTKAAVDDLGRYGNALDKAIMKYHALKMQEINESIDELWKSTYRGADVDTIYIHSDSAEATATGSTNRTHNYSVFMSKSGTEMEMRGRCSAGQRMLAAIIIRLALAECFGVNCGMIALDEPTTNLDRDNIKSLADSLHEIIKVRQKQRNFQLIIITHDEEFLRHMRVSDFAEEFWRVSRGAHERSETKKEEIAKLMDV